MARTSNSSDALLEILSLCEQALTGLNPQNEAVPNRNPSDKSNHFRNQRRAKLAHQLRLIQGGLSTSKHRLTDRWSGRVFPYFLPVPFSRA